MTNVVYEGEYSKVKHNENTQRRDVKYLEYFKIPTPEGEHLRILNLGIKWKWVASFMLRPLNSWKKKNSMCHTPGTDVVQENNSGPADKQTVITPGRSFSQSSHYADLCWLIKLPVRGLKP